MRGIVWATGRVGRKNLHSFENEQELVEKLHIFLEEQAGLQGCLVYKNCIIFWKNELRARKPKLGNSLRELEVRC